MATARQNSLKTKEDNLKQQFIVDNRAGAAGTIGATAVARNPADGYTVMIQSTTHVANAYMYKSTREAVLWRRPSFRARS
jgi:tripartite-type tricarboxylate transporter receptor subunit TctC